MLSADFGIFEIMPPQGLQLHEHPSRGNAVFLVLRAAVIWDAVETLKRVSNRR